MLHILLFQFTVKQKAVILETFPELIKLALI